MRRILAPLLVAAGYGLGLAAWHRLPGLITPDFSELLPFIGASDARPISRASAAFSLPTLALAMWLIFLWAPTRTAERIARRFFPAWLFPETPSPEATERLRVNAGWIGVAAVAVIITLHAAGIATALGAKPSVYHAVPFLLGIALLFGGNSTPLLRRNWFAGIRMRRTLADPQTWARIHRIVGRLLVLVGAATLVTTFAAGRYAFTVAIGGLALSALAALFVGTPGRTSLPSAPGSKP